MRSLWPCRKQPLMIWRNKEIVSKNQLKPTEFGGTKKCRTTRNLWKRKKLWKKRSPGWRLCFCPRTCRFNCPGRSTTTCRRKRSRPLTPVSRICGRGLRCRLPKNHLKMTQAATLRWLSSKTCRSVARKYLQKASRSIRPRFHHLTHLRKQPSSRTRQFPESQSKRK